MILIITCLALLALAVIVTRLIMRMTRQRAAPSLWVTLLVATLVGAGLGYALNSIPVRIGAETKVYGLPMPYVILIKEGSGWTDFVYPKPMIIAFLILNVFVFGLGGAACIWRPLVRRMNSQNQALHATSEPAPGAVSSSHEG